MNSPFRFVHTADLHLDSPLKSLARRDPSLAAHVSNATREAFKRTIDLCLEERVQALLIAGDIYDSVNPSVATVGFFKRELDRLKNSGTRVYLIRGNHDHHAKLTTTLTLPEHVVEFTGNKKVDVLKELGVAIHGVSFKEEHATESALRSFKAPDESLKNIALLHTSLGGSEGHDIYAPCTVAELDSMGFDYWALGHIHTRQIYTKESTIVMPGTPQGRDMGEVGNKSVSLVTLDEDNCQVEERIVCPVRFERIAIHLTDIQISENHSDSVLKALVDAFSTEAQALKDTYTMIDRWIIRIECHAGNKSLYPLKVDSEHTDESIRLAAETLGNVHLDKIQYSVSTATDSSNTTELSLLKQLEKVVMTHLDDDILKTISDKEFDELVKLIPTKKTRDQLQDSAEQRSKTIHDFQTQGVRELLSMIQIDRVTEY